jgi:predicted kinase
VRKRAQGLSPRAHAYAGYGQGLYDPSITEATYREMTREALAAARSGKRVVVDATFLFAGQRQAFHDACKAAGLDPFFVWCTADASVLRERVARRTREGGDISDAHPAVLEGQLCDMEEPAELPSFRVMRLDTGRDTPEAIRQSLALFL